MFGSIQHLAQFNSTRLASSRIWPGSAWINAVGFALSNEKVKQRFPLSNRSPKRDTHTAKKKLFYQITKRLKLYNNRIVKQTEASSSSSYFMFYWSFPLCYCSIEDFCRLFAAIKLFMHFFLSISFAEQFVRFLFIQIKRKLTQSYWHWPPQSCWIFYIHSSPVCVCTFEIRVLFKIIFIFKWKFHSTHTLANSPVARDIRSMTRARSGRERSTYINLCMRRRKIQIVNISIFCSSNVWIYANRKRNKTDQK